MSFSCDSIDTRTSEIACKCVNFLFFAYFLSSTRRSVLFLCQFLSLACGTCSRILPWSVSRSNFVFLVVKNVTSLHLCICLPHAGSRTSCALDPFIDFGTMYIIYLFAWLPQLLPFCSLIFPYLSACLLIFYFENRLALVPGQRS